MKKNNIKKWASLAAFLFVTIFSATSFMACSETDDSIDEFPDWQAKNDTYWNNLYTTTKQKIDAGDTSWKMILTYSKQGQTLPNTGTVAYKPEDYIIVHINETGTGTTSPIYTDSVRVHYQGRIIPSTTYTSGLIFDTSWSGNIFNAKTSRAAHWAVKESQNNNLIINTGLTTALQKMHAGDHWTVYIPYQLGYGTQAHNGVPAYSNLIFDLRLVDFAPAGTPLGNN